MKEYKDIDENPDLCPNCVFSHREDNPYLCYFVIHHLDLAGFKNGFYLGSMTISQDYPLAPPSIRLHTPNGRFIPNKNICLTITDFHPEGWSPVLKIYNVLLGLISFMATEDMTVGGI